MRWMTVSGLCVSLHVPRARSTTRGWESPSCPLITTSLFKKDGHDFTSCNSVIDIVYNTNVINPIAKLIVRSPVGKLL